MILTIGQIFKAQEALNKLIGQELAYDVSVAFVFWQVKKRVDELVEFTWKRLEDMYGSGFDLTKMSDEELVPYALLMSSSVNFTPIAMDFEKTITNHTGEVALTVNDVDALSILFEDKKK